MRAPLGALCTTSESSRACRRAIAHWLETTAPSCGERVGAAVAVLVDGVAADLGHVGPDRRVGVVAVARLREAVAVAVEVRVVAAVAVLVDAVVEHLGRAGEDVRGAVVAVDGGAEAVAVAVDPALALGDDVDEVVVRLVGAGAARDPLRPPVARLDHVVAGLAEVVVDPGARRRGCRCPRRRRGRRSRRSSRCSSFPGPPATLIGADTAGRVEDVVALAEVDGDARALRALDRRRRRRRAQPLSFTSPPPARLTMSSAAVARDRDVVGGVDVVDDRDDPGVRVAVDGRAERAGGSQREPEHGEGEKAKGRAHRAHPLQSARAGATLDVAGTTLGRSDTVSHAIACATPSTTARGDLSSSDEVQPCRHVRPVRAGARPRRRPRSGIPRAGTRSASVATRGGRCRRGASPSSVPDGADEADYPAAGGTFWLSRKRFSGS